MRVGIDTFETNGFPSQFFRLWFCCRAEFEFLSCYGCILARAIPKHRIAVFIRINLVEVNLGLRHGFSPRRILSWPGRSVIHLRDRFPVVKPKLLAGRASVL